MKIFALYFRFKPTITPPWFDTFHTKYTSSSIFHITLVQPRYIEEDKIQEIKERTSKVLKDFSFTPEDKRLIFDESKIEKEGDTCMFMWMIRRNEKIMSLQKQLVEELKDFNNYCDEETKEYESNFEPHMTVAEGIPNPEEVSALLVEDRRCEWEIVDLVLPVVVDTSVEASENPEDMIVFSV